MPNKDPRYEVDDPEIESLLKSIGEILSRKCPDGWGFALQIFKFHGEAFFYISNADRKDMVKALREFINREQ